MGVVNARQGRFEGIWQYVRARWPAYLTIFGGGGLTAFLLISIGAERRNWYLVGLGVLLLLLLAYFLTTSLWAAHEQLSRRDTSPSHTIFELGKIQPIDQIVYVGLGLRQTPLRLSRRMTRGRVQAIDVYNPQLTPSAVLARRRRMAQPSAPDPRLSWSEGNIGLLPLPDHSVGLVATSYTLIEFWQEGDRRLLLKEMKRILKPGGHLVIAEPARTPAQLMMLGPASWRLPPPDYWRDLLTEAGFRIVSEELPGGYYHFIRAEKPFPGAVQQLTLDLGV